MTSQKKIFPERNIVKEIGYKTNAEVFKYYLKSEISVGNSVWDEPLGRIAIESSSRKCLPIISNKAGLNESKEIAFILKNNTPEELFKILKKLTRNNNLRKELQHKYYLNNKFFIKKTSSQLDLIRSNFLIKKMI